MSDQRPIGIFDSGVGGLTVVKELIRILPHEDIIYFGDTARVPYGSKSKETVIRFSIENILFLLKHRVKLIVVACNTASSVALSEIEQNFKVPILGVIKPGAQEAVQVTKNKKIGIIGTKATIKSKAYEKQIKLIAPEVKTYSVGCPLFVPLVEEGWLDSRITKEIIKQYLSPLKEKGIDTLILGCTHYPLLKPVISGVLGGKVNLIDSAKQVSLQAKTILEFNKLLAGNIQKKGKICFNVSDEPESFAELGHRFLGIPIKNIRKVK